MLRLPSTRSRPLPSPELTGPVDGGQGRAGDAPARLGAWTVDVLTFAPAAAAQLLGELFDPYPWTAMLVAEQAGHDTELHFGASLRWLVAAHDVAWRTARRAAVLPALVTGHDDRPHARWRPVPDRPYVAALGALADAAPPSVLAHLAQPAHPSAAGAATRALDALVDAEVRAALDGAPPLLRPGRAPANGPGAPRAWVRALTTASGEVLGADPAELADLRRRIARWHRSSPDPTPLLLGLRLEEPLATSEDDWHVAFTARVAAEPAIVVDAERMWAGGAALAALERSVPGAEEAFLDELERAARCWPPLRPALRSGRPQRLDLDRAGALDFLRDGAPGLADAGFEVLLPAWWRRPPAVGLRMHARPRERAGDPGTVRTRSLLDRDVVVEFDWRAAIGDTPLREQELERLAEATIPLVRLRGQWLVADRDQIAAALAFLRREGRGVSTVGEVLRLGLDDGPTVAGLPAAVEADGPLGDVLAGRVPVAVPELPEGFGTAFRTTLRPYQQRGVTWLAVRERLGLGAVLADDMGLGKTVQALALLVADRLGGGAQGPTLLVCPMSLVGNWRHEAARFAPSLRVHVHHGADRHDVDLAAAAARCDLVVTTYAVAHRDAERLRQVRWHRLLVDEAHLVKNRAALQSRAVRSIEARHRLALTGTPLENRLADLHAVLDLVNPGLFGSAEAFKERYAMPVERHASLRAAAELRRRTAPLLLRRLKAEVADDLPEKVEMTVHCTLTVEQAALYQAVVRDVLHRLETSPRLRRGGVHRRGVVLASLSKLKQVCNHPAQFLQDSSRVDGRSGKVARLEEILEEVVAAGERALCFTQFARFGALLQPHLQRALDREVLFMHGGLARGERDRLVERFAADDGPAVFLLSLKAGGTGLNLTAANHVVHLDRWWNPAVEDQATDRAHRIGQRRDVQVRRLVCAGTVEERIDEVIAGKRALADLALASGEAALADLTTERLAGLLALTEPGVD